MMNENQVKYANVVENYILRMREMTAEARRQGFRLCSAEMARASRALESTLELERSVLRRDPEKLSFDCQEIVK